MNLSAIPRFLAVLFLGLVTSNTIAQGAGYWHTSGNRILDSNSQQVRIAGINWYGFETDDAVVHGLSGQDYKSILNTVHTLGYNTIRVPFSNQMIETPSYNLNITYWAGSGPANTDLQGLNSLQVLDKIVDYAGTIGLKIILDNHRSEAGNSAEASGLWYTGAYPESAWINDWTMLAARYENNPTVVGFDLRNEPHNAFSGGSCWSCGAVANDWHLAAERAGNAILSVNPNLLIFVEGTDAYLSSDFYWWGGNLEGVANAPVTLAVPNRVVYSAHDYGPVEYAQTWFPNDSAASLYSVWTQHWAYIDQQGIAPVWVGEFGTDNISSDIVGSASGSQALWFQSPVGFLKSEPTLSWTCWALNGEDNYGLLDSNYDPTPVNPLKQATLATIQFPLVLISPPSAASGLTASASSASQINLNWTASPTSGVTYTVFFGTSPGAISTVLSSGIASTGTAANNLNPSTTYYFTVAAVSSNGSSPVSAAAFATTQAPPAPVAPAGLTATAVSTSQINLTWTASPTSGVTYSVYVGVSAAAINTLAASGLAGTSFQSTGLTASSPYYYTVKAVSTWGASAPSTTATATTQAQPAPAAPTGLTANAVTASQINLNWTPSSTAGVTYNVYVGQSPSSITTLAAGGLTSAAFQATGLTASTSYYYTVKALANAIFSATSNTASATTLAPPAPVAPTALAATAVSPSQINLTWAASPTPAVTYNVYTGSNPSAITTLVASGLAGTSFQSTGLTASTGYYYAVTAVSTSGASTASPAAFATTQAPPAPTAPTALTATAISTSQINLVWIASPTPGVTYSVYTGSSPAAITTLAAGGLTSTGFQSTGLTASTTYYYTVKAVSTAGTSAASAAASATTQTSPLPAAPTSLSATAMSDSEIKLSWTASSTAGVTYSVYIGQTHTAITTLVASGLTSTIYRSDGLTASTPYYYIVKAVAASGTSIASVIASAATQPTPAPDAPASLTATAISTSQIGLVWAASAGPSVTYSVYIGQSPSAMTTVAASGLTSTSFQSTGLTASTPYYYAVKAVASSVVSVSSPIASATTLALGVPSSPSALAATATSPSQITLYWTASPTPNVTYTVLSGNNLNAIATVVASGLPGTTTQVVNLNPSTTYYFTVIAVAASRNSAAAAAAAATTQAIPPPIAPANLIANAASCSEINVSWTPSPTPGVTYNLYVGTSAGAITTLLAGGLTNPSTHATGLAPLTTYYYMVKAVAGSLSSAFSNSVAATTSATPAPNAPATVVANVMSSSQIDLTWAPSSTPGVTYNVYAVIIGVTSSKPIATGLTSLHYSLTGLARGTTYYTSVRAVTIANPTLSAPVFALPANTIP